MKISMSVLGKCIVESQVVPKWKPFHEYLKMQGFELVPIRSSSSTYHVDLECASPTILHFSKHLTPEKRVLVRVEPRCVNAFQYTAKVNSFYENHVVISAQFRTKSRSVIWENGHLDSKSILTQNLCVGNHRRIRKGIAVLNQNKFSSNPGEFYSLRKSAINEFLRNGIQVDLGGKDWAQGLSWELKSRIKSLAKNHPYYPFSLRNFTVFLNKASPFLTLKGSVEDAITFLSNYEFCLVIENENTYVSEKLLNAIIAGCIPVYIGPKLHTFGFPENVAIEAQADAKAIVEAFRTITATDILRIRTAGRHWIQSEEAYDRWGVRPGFNRLASIIKNISIAH